MCVDVRLVDRNDLYSFPVTLVRVTEDSLVHQIEKMAEIPTRSVDTDKRTLAGLRNDRLSHRKRYRKPVGPVSSIQPIP